VHCRDIEERRKRNQGGHSDSDSAVKIMFHLLTVSDVVVFPASSVEFPTRVQKDRRL